MPTHFIHGELGILVAFLQLQLVVLQESADHHHVICTSHKISNSGKKFAGPLFVPSSLWCYFSTDPESLVRFILPMNSLLKIHDDLTPLSWLLWTTSSMYTLTLPWQIGVL